MVTYERIEVETVLGCMLRGSLTEGDPLAPDKDMPKAQGNPATLGDEIAIMIDCEYAYKALANQGQLDRDLLWCKYGYGMEGTRIARLLNCKRSYVEEKTAEDIGLLTEAMNQGLKPTRGTKQCIRWTRRCT